MAGIILHFCRICLGYSGSVDRGAVAKGDDGDKKVTSVGDLDGGKKESNLKQNEVYSAGVESQ